MKDSLSERQERLAKFRKTILNKEEVARSVDIPEGLFVKCEACGNAVYQRVLDKNDGVCPTCGAHFKIGAAKRIQITVDPGSFVETDAEVTSADPLGMPDYPEKLAAGKAASGMNEAFLSGTASITGIPVAVGVLDASFMMGSMGSAVGEKVARLVERATERRLPLVIFSASGGARMQEGILSLMQMGKTAGALARHDAAGLLYVSVLTHPTTGGVAASFASLGDVNIAEKSSLIGFAGPRVIKQTIRQELPEGFQTETFQLKHGAVDLVAARSEMRMLLSRLLRLHREVRP
ncbi:MAG: acetyl-CoA carboxylase, carboxyltransferase subunit beta [Candidatus Izemoplasmatales bacterium]